MSFGNNIKYTEQAQRIPVCRGSPDGLEYI